MIRKSFALLAATALLFGSAPAVSAQAPVPQKIGDCVTTAVKMVGPRLEGMPDSGSEIQYRNGLWQVTYDHLPAMATSRAGDAVKLCLTELPSDCPKGDDRGKVYHATNPRTHKSWDAMDSEHSCGGA